LLTAWYTCTSAHLTADDGTNPLIYTYVVTPKCVTTTMRLADYTGQQIKKNCICDEYVINLFVCIYEVRKGT